MNISRVWIRRWWFSNVARNRCFSIWYIHVDIQFWYQFTLAKYVYVLCPLSKIVVFVVVCIQSCLHVAHLITTIWLIFFFFVQFQTLVQLFNSKKISSCQKHSFGWPSYFWPGSFLPKTTKHTSLSNILIKHT